MALVEGCKHTLEITVPVEAVNAETEQVVAEIQKKVRIPGFRQGKVPLDLIRSRYKDDIRQQVLDNLLPKHFNRRVQQEELRVVGNPSVRDVHYHSGEPLRFTAEFEVAPEFELKEYRGAVVSYSEPEVTDADVEKRLGELRENKAEYINEEPRPAADGDYAVVSLKSLGGVEGKPIDQDELVLHIGDEETLPDFSQALRGMSPGEEKWFEVTYPSDYAQERLSNKTVQFRMGLKMIRRKELPELNDAFAQDLGDFKTLEELREAVRKSLFREKEYAAQQAAKDRIVEKLVAEHEFPVPEAFIERQIEIHVEQYVRTLAAQGVDPKTVKLDWEKVKASQRDKAIHDVKASLLLDRIADRESIDATRDEVDRELNRMARQQREPVAAVRMKMEKDGSLRRLVSRIRTEKTLNFLFERATKQAS